MPQILPRARSRLLTLRPSPTNRLDPLLSRVVDLTPAWTRAAAVIRGLVVEEIDRQWWRPPSGPPRPWPQRKAFGRRVLPDDVFGPEYRRAWAGGAGSVLEIKPATMAVGVDTRRFRWIKYHRPGLGPLKAADVPDPAFVVSYERQQRPWKLAKTSRRYKGAQRYAIWWFFALEYGVYLKEETLRRGLQIPARPHATVNPQMRTSITAIINQHVLGAS